MIEMLMNLGLIGVEFGANWYVNLWAKWWGLWGEMLTKLGRNGDFTLLNIRSITKITSKFENPINYLLKNNLLWPNPLKIMKTIKLFIGNFWIDYYTKIF